VSTHSDIVTHIAAVLNTVSDISSYANVITRPKNLDNMDEIVDAFSKRDGDGNEIINAWVISREGIRMERTGAPSSHEFRVHTYICRFYYSMSEDLDSDDTFQALLNDVLDAFIPRRQKATEAATPAIEDTISMAFRNITNITFVGHWVHYAELELVMVERVTAIDYVGIG